jgi:hypothetical protein
MEKINTACPKCSISGGLTYNISQTNLAKFDCQTCVYDFKLPLSSNSNGNANPSLTSELVALNNGLKEQDVEWKITEGFPPIVNHSDTCHYTGSCVDAGLIIKSPENIKRFTETARNNGLNPNYEVKTQAEADKLISDLKALKMENPSVSVNPLTNGSHFHVKI